jgi:dipeptidyl aminopeptidase/acylaminoacyl peptidase
MKNDMRKFLLLAFTLTTLHSFSQTKKPLTHDVYDGWKSAGERTISNDGKYTVYAINPQEGDGTLYFTNLLTLKKDSSQRGYNAAISEDNKYAFFKIRPEFQATRKDKIKKKKPDEMTKDSLGIKLLGTDSLIKIPRVKSFKVPEKASGWLAYQKEKVLPDTSKKRAVPDSVRKKIIELTKLADSVIAKALDSVKGKIERQEVINATQKAVKEIYKKADELEDLYAQDADGDDAAGGAAATEGTDLVVRNTATGAEKTFKLVSEYAWSKNGRRLFMETTKNAKDSNSKAYVMMYNPEAGKADTVLAGFSDARSFAFDEDGSQLAFVAERDSSAKALQKFFKLYYFKAGADSAVNIADRNTTGILKGTTVSENADIRFSKDGRKLFFGTAAIVPAKDTNLVDFELARLDVWHYNDDYIQPQQLKQLPQELKRSYVAVIMPGQSNVLQLGADSSENISLVDEGNADFVLAQSTKGNRIAAQWEGRSLSTAYLISTKDGSRKLIRKNALGNYTASPKGKYVYWYDPKEENYFTYNTATGAVKNISEKIRVPLFDTENDVPDYPGSVGITGWTEDDKYFLVNDEYDIWKTDPDGNAAPINVTAGFGRKGKINFDYVRLDPEQRFLKADEKILLRSQNKTNKDGGFYTVNVNGAADPVKLTSGQYSFGNPLKAKNAEEYIFSRGSIASSELFASSDLKNATQLTDIAAQQLPYNWLTAELVHWKMFDGKMSEGILYKPQNFDPNKKYPIIFYFYERDADGLYNYRSPAPSASTINVPYFVSNEYLVFDPNIYYKTGEPGQSAYNSVVSAAKYLSKMPWVDSTRMGIQGQSWGGYQVAYLVTRTNIFRAAEAGAPVSNMTSAYGGVRWGAGISRQFQYEKSQSRLGATLWQRPDLYIKNSALFSADKINTPLMIMHNDADGAVPWYQSIELFTAMKRLGKKVWMVEYNGEDHNLVERKNRKDLSVRLSQFFDYYLKDAKPADWIKYGVPATQKGINWGLHVSE